LRVKIFVKIYSKLWFDALDSKAKYSYIFLA
jgi:hypothetical protein